MKKPVLALNFLWAIVAAGTFYAGVVWREGRAPSQASTRTVKIPNAPEPLRGAGDEKSTAKKGSISRDDDVLDFFKRYGLDGDTPLTADVMKRAVTEALRETNPIKSQMLFARLMEELTPENAPAALAMLKENLSGFDSFRYMGMLAYAWGEKDPQAAMEQLSQGGDRGGRMGQSTALAGWASQDPKGAMAWLEAYKGDGKEWLSQSLISGLAKSDFDAAIKYAGALKDDGDRSRAAETLARELIRGGGVEKAKDWFASLTDPKMKGGAFETVAQQLMRSDPEQAAAFVKLHANEEFAAGAVRTMADEIGRKDVQKGLQFASELAGTAQARAYGQVIGEWMDRNDGAESVQASEYVSKMPPGEGRDAGASTIARRMAGEDPAAAIAWANSIQNPQQREDSLVDVGRRYLRTDPQAGAAWLAQSGLSAEAQQKVTAPREGRGGPGGGPGGPGGQGGPGGRGGPGGGRGGFGGGRPGR